MTIEKLKELIEIVSQKDSAYGISHVISEHGCQLGRGATKYCIIIPDNDFVIKFAEYPEDRDYAGDELEAYEKAEKFGVQKILPRTWFFCESSNGWKFYAQEKVDSAYDGMSRKQRNKMQKATKTASDKTVMKIRNSCFYGHVEYHWVAMATSYYGKNFMKSFEQWTHECKVNDLHDGNIGFLRGKPVILDFSGYNNY